MSTDLSLLAHDIVGELDAAVDPDSDDRLFATFAGLDPRATARGLITDVFENRSAMRVAQMRSCHHALGFDRLTLLDNPAGYQVRLHVWEPCGMRGTEDRHDHRASFASAVLLGNLSYDVFAIDPAGERAFDELVETSEVADSEWRFSKTRTTRLSLVETVSLTAPDRYRLPDDVIHRVHVPAGTLTITLMLQGPKRRSGSRVYVPAGELVPQRRAQPRLREAELRIRLQAALDELG